MDIASVTEFNGKYGRRFTYKDDQIRCGVEPIHQQSIIECGYGYNVSVSNFCRILSFAGINEKKAIAQLRVRLMKGYYDDIEGVMVSFLRKRGVKNADALIRNIDADSNVTDVLLKDGL